MTSVVKTNVESEFDKMSNKDGDNVPDVRFNEFNDEWETHRIGDFLSESRERGHTGLDAKKLTVKLWGKGVVEKTDSSVGSVHTQYYLRKSGQFIYSKLDFLNAAFGIIPDSLDGYESTLDLPAFDLVNIDSQFLMRLVLQERFYLENGIIANGSRKAKRIHADTFLDFDVLSPSIEEQSKIGCYFNQLDEIINDQQQKLDKFQSLKVAMLDKMFPKEGSTVPEIRFNGFNYEWETHRIGDFLSESRELGHTGLDAKKLTVKLWGKGVVEKTDSSVGSVNTQYYVRKSGQFVYSKLDFLNAAFGIIPDSLDGYESTLDLPAFDLINIDSQFLMRLVVQESFYLKNGIIANGSRKAKRIHTDTFLDFEILTPTIDEQIKIGKYFSSLDRVISLSQQKLNKLQSIKKALLAKMFV